MQILQVWRVIWLKMPVNCNFYVLSDAHENGRFLFACALIEKLYAHGHRVYVHCENQQDLTHVNTLLWTYKDISFIPHSLSGENTLEDSPIQLGINEPGSNFNDINDVLVFLSLSPNVPVFYQQFSRVVEIVNADPAIKESLRMRYQYYRSQDCEIKTHQIKNT